MSQQRICKACGCYFKPKHWGWFKGRPVEELLCPTCLLMDTFRPDPASTSASTSADREVSPHTPESTVACGDHSNSTEAVVGSGTEPGANKDHWMDAAEQYADLRNHSNYTASRLIAAFLAGADYAIKRCKESVEQLNQPKE